MKLLKKILGRRERKAAAKEAIKYADLPAPEGLYVGLYSFPKSGNTWLRHIIAEAMQVNNESGNLQKFITDSHFGGVFENPIRHNDSDVYFYKSHYCTLRKEIEGRAFDTDKIIYIYRHPLDVFVSYLNFVSEDVSPQGGASMDIKISKVKNLALWEMESLFQTFCEHGTITPKNMAFGGYFGHVNYFKNLHESRDIDILVLRYEDMLVDFSTNLRKILRFLDINLDDAEGLYERVEERTSKDGKFFWSKTNHNCLNYLTVNQVREFESRFSNELLELGYTSILD